MTGRDRMVVIVVVVLAAIVGSWLMVIQPKRSQASKLQTQVNAAQSQLDSARSLLSQNEAAKSTFPAEYASIARLGEAVPADDDVPSLIFQIQSAATKSDVDFRSLQLAPGSGSSTAASSSSASQSSTATLPPGASVGPAGFPTEPFTFTFTGNFFHLADFFHRLQRFVIATNNRLSVSGRLMTLNAISLGPSHAGFPHIVATISATTYLLPSSQGLTAGASPGGPAAPASPAAPSQASAAPTAPAAVTAP